MTQLSCWATLNGNPVGDGPLLVTSSGDIPMTELGQSNKGSLVLAAADERAVLAMAPYTMLEVVQEDVGTIFIGYVLNPRQQITDRDEHTITLDLVPLTEECIWRLTRRGWIAANWLSVIAARLGSLVPGWTGVMPKSAVEDIQVTVTLNSPTVLGGFLETAKQFGTYVRLGRDAASGTPLRRLEMGQFGAAPTMWLTGPNGGDADAMHGNPLIRLVATVDRQPNDVSNLRNVCVPFGGGANDTLVTLERLWRIVNDPLYPNYGKYGTAPGSVFPEYDPVNYPISDPEHPPIGIATHNPDGSLLQGALGTRGITLDGHFDYLVYDAASYFGTATTPAYGHKETQFIDSGLTYADYSVANQELTERALYLSCIANFKRVAHPHHLFTCTADGTGYPTQAGDLIAVDYQRVSTNDQGAVVEMNVTENLRVMSVTRHFAAGATPMDTYTLSNLGRFDETDATGAVYTANQMIALQINQGTSLAPLTVYDTDNVDAVTPMVTHVSVPKTLFRWQRCNLRVDFEPYRASATTAQNQTLDFSIITPGQDILLDTPNDLSLSAIGATPYDDAKGWDTSTDKIGGMPLHYHDTTLHGAGAGGISPDNTTQFLTGLVASSGPLQGTVIPYMNHRPVSDALNMRTTSQQLQPDLAPTAGKHVVGIAKTVAKKFTTVARLAATTIIATLPKHTHPLDQRIPIGTPTAPYCSVAINGQSLSSNLKLLSGSRSSDGTFPNSFEIDDISAMLNGITGDLDITLGSGTSASNPYGAGRFKLSATFFGEFGGLTSTVRAA